MTDKDYADYLSLARKMMGIIEPAIQLWPDDDLQQLTDIAEKEFALKFNLNRVVFTRSGTEAFVTALLAIGIKEGDEVILPVSICQSMINAVILLGATPVLADTNIGLALSPEDTLKKISPKTRVIVYYHPFGMVSKMDWLLKLKEIYPSLCIIEDCAQVLGAEGIGVRGDLSIFSFGRGKPFSVGAGGAVGVNVRGLIDELLLCCRSGVFDQSDYEVLGFNSTLSYYDLYALLARLDQFSGLLQAKMAKAQVFLAELANYGQFIDVPEQSLGIKNVFHRVIFKPAIKDLDRVYDKAVEEIKSLLYREGLSTVQDTCPVPPYQVPFLHKYYQQIGRQDLCDLTGVTFPVWKSIEKQYLYLRTNEILKLEDIYKTCDILIQVITKLNKTGEKNE